MTADVPHSPVNAAIAEIERLKARLAVKCQHPSVEGCARLWAEDANQRQLVTVDPTLAREFPFGRNTVEHLATSLLADRKARDALQAEITRQARQIAEQSVHVNNLTRKLAAVTAENGRLKAGQPKPSGNRGYARLGEP